MSTTTIAGYYTLTAASVSLTDLAPEHAKKLPRYPSIPAALVGRLAVDSRFAGRALGSALLYDAATRAANSGPAVFALLVEAKDEGAAGFYRHFGFRSFASRPLGFYYPLSAR